MPNRVNARRLRDAGFEFVSGGWLPADSASRVRNLFDEHKDEAERLGAFGPVGAPARPKPPLEIPDQPITKVSHRAIMALAQLDPRFIDPRIKPTPQDFAEHTKDDYRFTVNTGAKTVAEIEIYLASHGLQFKPAL